MRPLEADRRQACSMWTEMDFQLIAVNGHAWKIALRAPVGQRVWTSLPRLLELGRPAQHASTFPGPSLYLQWPRESERRDQALCPHLGDGGIHLGSISTLGWVPEQPWALLLVLRMERK